MPKNRPGYIYFVILGDQLLHFGRGLLERGSLVSPQIYPSCRDHMELGFAALSR